MNNPGQDLSEIRSMMEKSSRVLFLSGLAGIVIGCIALAGVFFSQYINGSVTPDKVQGYLLADAMLVLVAAIVTVLFFSNRMARQKGLPGWNATVQHLVTELAVPLSAGGAVCIALLIHETYWLLPSTMLVFYGLALFGASKYAVTEVRFLGLAQLCLGILAAIIPDHALNLWALGFGACHIVFGLRIYFAYER